MDTERASIPSDALHLFVGREAEIAAWNAALELATPTIVHVTGTGGIGKSALLRAFVERARAGGIAVRELDARALEPSIPGVRGALDEAGFGGGNTRIALVIDTYEELASCDFFVRAEVLKRIGPHVVVIAGRMQPDPGWFANNGWGVRVLHLPLKHLDDRETNHYLERRGLLGSQSDAVRAFCQGHPLALALAVEAQLQSPTQSFQPGSDPDVVGALLEQFMRDIPDDASRVSLEVCAVTRHLREDLLADFLGADAAAEAFPWLRKLSFVERTRNGVRLHDVARGVILADLRWRNPSRFEELFASARRVLADRGEKTDVGDSLQKTEDIQLLLRLAPELRDRVEPTTASQLALDEATAVDAARIEEIVRAHEGETSVDTFRRWFADQPERFVVLRSPGEEVLGFACSLRLDARSDTDPDQRLRRVWQHARRLVGSDPGDVLYAPFWMTKEGYHRIDDARLALGAAIGRWMHEPRPVAFAYCHSTSTPTDAALFERTGARPVRELGFQQNGVDQAVFVYDRRGMTPLQWYVRCLRAMDAAAPSFTSNHPASRPQLDRTRFESELRNALRNLHDASQLKQSPLVDASFVGESPPGRSARALRLRASLVEHIEALRGSPQGERHYRALHAAFVDVADNQELAAERLGMAYSTFRRYLAAGMARLADALWSLEMGEGN